MNRIVRLADEVGIEYAWFSEHHSHAHHGHLPAPLLLALALASETRSIRLGTAIICLNLHHPLDIAEQVATADLLMNRRLAPGFGSGSSPAEFGMFGLDVTLLEERRERFNESLQMVLAAWCGQVEESSGPYFPSTAHSPLPVAGASLHSRSWLAVNSSGTAEIAGRLNFNVLFSHLRTPEQYCEYTSIYHSAGGSGVIATNRPVYVGETEDAAWAQAEPALRTLWRRFRLEGKIPDGTPEPDDPKVLARHPINFVVGDAESVARQLADLHRTAPYSLMNAEVNWPGLSQNAIHNCVRRLGGEVRRHLDSLLASGPPP